MDFGNGFYTTRDYEQAAGWAAKFGDGIANSDLAALNSRTFAAGDPELADFAREFRSGVGTETPPNEMVEGPMLRNVRPFLRGASPVWFGNQVVFYDETEALLNAALR